VLYERPRRARAILALLLAASIVVITIDFRQRLAIAVFGPLQQGASAVVRPIGNLIGGVAHLGDLRSENRRLRAEVAELRAHERTYLDVLGENERLRGALRMARRCGCRTVGASVVARSGSNFQLSVTVDAGANQGIARDMAVVDAGGLVGRVTQVTADYATVLLVTDPTSGVAATLASGKAPGIVKGRGEALLEFQPVRAGTTVKLGDAVVTRGYQGSVFPAGLPIGVVERVDPAGAASLVPRVDVRPYAALGTLDVVAVVVDRPRPPGPPAPRGKGR
jgi:rod shape-determining protein MreC